MCHFDLKGTSCIYSLWQYFQLRLARGSHAQVALGCQEIDTDSLSSKLSVPWGRRKGLICQAKKSPSKFCGLRWLYYIKCPGDTVSIGRSGRKQNKNKSWWGRKRNQRKTFLLSPETPNRKFRSLFFFSYMIWLFTEQIPSDNTYYMCFLHSPTCQALIGQA